MQPAGIFDGDGVRSIIGRLRTWKTHLSRQVKKNGCAHQGFELSTLNGRQRRRVDNQRAAEAREMGNATFGLKLDSHDVLLVKKLPS
jgi:hypothetical protein